jgi:hypothetical protein
MTRVIFMDLRIISHKDPEIKQFREEILKYVQTYESMGLKILALFM